MAVAFPLAEAKKFEVPDRCSHAFQGAEANGSCPMKIEPCFVRGNHPKRDPNILGRTTFGVAELQAIRNVAVSVQATALAPLLLCASCFVHLILHGHCRRF